jgi:hypothetical protein
MATDKLKLFQNMKALFAVFDKYQLVVISLVVVNENRTYITFSCEKYILPFTVLTSVLDKKSMSLKELEVMLF